jgi:hypothetical protein
MDIRLLLVSLVLFAGLACDKVVKEARVPAPGGDAQAALSQSAQSPEAPTFP